MEPTGDSETSAEFKQMPGIYPKEHIQYCTFRSLHFWQQTIRQKILDQMKVVIPWDQSALNFFMNATSHIRTVPKYFNFTKSDISKKQPWHIVQNTVHNFTSCTIITQALWLVLTKTALYVNEEGREWDRVDKRNGKGIYKKVRMVIRVITNWKKGRKLAKAEETKEIIVSKTKSLRALKRHNKMIGHPKNPSDLSKSIQDNAKTVTYQNHCTSYPSKTIIWV